MTSNPHSITSDSEKAFAQQLLKAFAAIRYVTGRESKVIIWPVGIPLEAMAPGELGTFNGVKVTAPREVLRMMTEWSNNS